MILKFQRSWFYRLISHNGWNIAYLFMKILHSGLFVDTLEVWLAVRINSLVRMDFKYGVKPRTRLEHS